jgi:hypothetical protein
MTVTYAWPNFGVNRFEMRIAHNTRAFISPFSSSAQVLNYTGERWQTSISLVPGNRPLVGGAIEAFVDRLCGPANRVTLWNLRRPVPLGTLRDGSAISVVNGSSAAVSVVNGSSAAVSVVGGTPVVASQIAAGANSGQIQTFVGRTVEAGDMLGLNGQLVRAMAAGTADGNGLLSIEFQPRARAAIPAFTVVQWNQPTANFMLKTESPATTWRPGMYESTSLELIEAI